MKNFNEVCESKKMVNEAFKVALQDKAVKKAFMKYLRCCMDGAPENYLTGLESYGDAVFGDAAPKAIQKALYRFKDINDQYIVRFGEKAPVLESKDEFITKKGINPETRTNQIEFRTFEASLFQIDLVNNFLIVFKNSFAYSETSGNGLKQHGYEMNETFSKNELIESNFKNVHYEVNYDASLTLIITLK